MPNIKSALHGYNKTVINLQQIIKEDEGKRLINKDLPQVKDLTNNILFKAILTDSQKNYLKNILWPTNHSNTDISMQG